VSSTLYKPFVVTEISALPEGSDAWMWHAKLTHSRFASYIAARYNGPVYLVGSSLKAGAARDVDVRVIVNDREFAGRYGCETKDGTGCPHDWPNQRWIDDMAKRSGELARDFEFNADFQVYPAGHCIQFQDAPRILLAAPSNLDHINACVAWFYAERPVTEKTSE
jgi:hypothetical protein